MTRCPACPEHTATATLGAVWVPEQDAIGAKRHGMQNDLLIVVGVAGNGGEIVVREPRLERQGARRHHPRAVHVVLHRVKGGEVEKFETSGMKAGIITRMLVAASSTGDVCALIHRSGFEDISYAS